MKLLLIGANGQVGDALRPRLAALGEVIVTTRSGTLPDGTACERLDLGEDGAARRVVETHRPDVVVNAAAYTAVDRAEDERDAAFRANADAPGELAHACAALDVPLVHYSTDYVFDGRGERPYREDDDTAPLGAYGESKLAGEQAIRTSGCRHVILRTAWVYGLHGHNFLRTMLRLAAERDELRVVADQVGAPTPAWLIADVTRALIEQGRTDLGVRHLTANGQTSWHGFASAIVETAHARGLLARRVPVVPITTAEFPTRARRPAYSVLDCGALQRDAGIQLPRWDAALAATLQRG
ncbi:MAG TPA: dTDP-4-dehydrorhamnose reductase [Lysobacter sp.]|nr:dTDP-4-dehydrorhamnose reductase [Lysobacter sp.]